MTVFNYAIFCEDEAIAIFINTVLPILLKEWQITDKVSPLYCEDFRKRYNGRTKSNTKKTCQLAVQTAILDYDIDICFVGVDADDDSYEKVKNELLTNLAHDVLIQKTIFAIPVQTIEYWLHYIKRKFEQPDLAKTTIIDDRPRYNAMNGKHIKKLVYEIAETRCTNEITNHEVKHLTERIDINFLCAHSDSFRHFYTELQTHFTQY
jgi:hypothetical protein